MMKKKNILLGTSVLYYSYLFYEQSAGINLLIFNLALVAIVLYLKNDIWKMATWTAVALGCLLSSACIVYHHTQLAITANLISLVALAGLSNEKHVSLVTALANSLTSLFSSHIIALTDRLGFNKIDETPEQTKAQDIAVERFAKKARKIAIPIVVTAVFLFIYMGANPAFNHLISNLFTSSSFAISWSWVFFTLGGFMLLFPFFFPYTIAELIGWDLGSSDRLSRIRRSVKDATFKMLDLRNEYQTGWLMFAMLNGLLLIVNSLDVYYLWIIKRLPAGIVYADYVHQGVYALILSIVLAISIILYFFRKNLNFYAYNQLLKNVTYAWILQNAFLLFTTYYKTMTYVNQFGLTHKRIGVFVYLTLTLIGLTTTFIKIYSIKGNWFLFRKNTWAFYTVLLIAACFNWDRIITSHNLQNIDNKEIDLVYLINDLSASNLPELLEYAKKLPDNHVTISYFHDQDTRVSMATPITYKTKEVITHKKVIFEKEYTASKQKGNCWQSWNYDTERIFQAVSKAE